MEDPKSVKLQESQGSDSKDEDNAATNTWVTVPNPHPSQIKARFSITQIEVSPPSPGKDASEDFDEEFLQFLIDEGIPVKILSQSDSNESLDNAGVIRSSSDKSKKRVQLEVDNNDKSSNTNDDVIQVTGLNQSIAKPIFLKCLPTIVDMQDEFEDLSDIDGGNSRKHSVISVENPIPLQKSSANAAENTPTMSIKKRVRFDLPKRKASIVGIYEYLPMSPSEGPERADHLSQINAMRKSWLSPPPSPQRRFSEDEDFTSALDSQNFLKRLLHNYRPSVDFSIYEDEDEEDKGDRIKDRDDLHQERELHSNDLRCGLYNWSPGWLQAFARKECYLAVFCIAGLVQGMFYTYNVAVISTLKKRFNFSGGAAGLILLGNDISQILLCILIAFFGTYGHRPRWMGVGAMISAVAAFVAATPHFIYGKGDIPAEIQSHSPSGFPAMTNTGLELCNNPLELDCRESQEKTYLFPAILLFISQFMVGTATSIFWTVGVSYLDDNASKRETPLYFAAFQVLRVLGPTLGFLFGGYCLSFWIDPHKEVNMSPYDPRYMGAWWMGFLIMALLMGCSGFLYFCFPRRLPSRNNGSQGFDPLFPLEDDEVKRLSTNSDRSERGGIYSFLDSGRGTFYLPTIKALPESIKRLFTNKIWVANFLSNVTFVMAMSGYWKFKPKHIEIQFRKSPSAANFYTGMATMIASVLGIGVSGFVFRMWRPRAKSVTAYNVFLTIFAIGSLFALMAIRCPPTKLSGHVPQKETWACAKDCGCSEKFDPVCAQDGEMTFYSPCYAGCSAAILVDNEIEYTNCSCTGKLTWKSNANASNGNETLLPSMETGWAIHGFCPEDCKAFSYYLGIQIFIKMIFATGKVGGMLVNLRSVQEKDKTLALGCMTVGIALLGFLPASVFMGTIIESSCLAWEESCQKRSSCLYYDSDKFGLLMHVVPAAFLVLSVIGDIVVFLNHAKLNLYGEEPHEMKELEEPLQSIKDAAATNEQAGKKP